MSARVESIEQLFGNNHFEGLVGALAEAQVASTLAADAYGSAFVSGMISDHDSSAVLTRSFLRENPYQAAHYTKREFTDFEALDEAAQKDMKFGWELEIEFRDERLEVAEEDAVAHGQESLTDQDLEEYLPTNAIASYKTRRAAFRAEEAASAQAKDFIQHADLDEFARWSTLHQLHSAKDGLSKVREGAVQTLGRFNALDVLLKKRAGELITQLLPLHYVVAVINDGNGLRARDDRYCTVTSGPEYSIRQYDLRDEATPTLLVNNATTATEMWGVANKTLLIGEWSDVFKVKKWEDAMSTLLFGKPMAGKLVLGRSKALGSKEHYERVVERARLVADVALGMITLDDVRARGVSIESQQKGVSVAQLLSGQTTNR